MANTFFENFKEVSGKIIPQALKNPYKEANLPSQNYSENTAAWQERVAVPFSYQKSDDGQRQYGLVYIPAFESQKFQDWGKISGGDVQTYGAELAEGMSLTPEGFNKLYKENKNSDFRWNDLSGLVSRKENGKVYGEKTMVDDIKGFTFLREALKAAQKDERENAARNQRFYNNYRNIETKRSGR